jgi:biopolymer transport protein ExbB
MKERNVKKKRNTQRAVASLGASLVGLLTVGVLILAANTLPQAGAQTDSTVKVAPASPGPSAQASGSPGGALIPTGSLLEIMKKGGILMYPIALCSVIMVAFVFERGVSLRRSRVIPKPFVTRFMQQIRDGQLDREQALTLCEENGSPVAEVFAGAVRKWGRPAVEVEQGVLDAGERATNGLRRYMRVLNAVHTISPLLGLLGTVTGMIAAFNSVAVGDALGRPERLAGGVSEALLTTAAGLTVAIPALIFYLYFTSRVDHLVMEMDSLGQELVNTISAEELQDRSQKARAKPVRSSRVEPTA